LDVLVAFFLVLVLLALLRFEQGLSLMWMFISAAALGCAILSKLYPVLLIPTCYFYLYRVKIGTLKIVQFFAVVAVMVVLGYLPFLSVDLFKITAGLSTYAQQWRMNDGLFLLLDSLFEEPRLIAVGLVTIVALMVPFLRGGRSVESLATCFQWVLLIWYLAIPTPFPWYAVPLVALAVTRPAGSATIVTIVLSGVTGLYYLSFFYEYHEYPGHWWIWTRVVEHSTIWITLVSTWFLSIGRARANSNLRRHRRR
jgi:hypothetical protein